MYMYIYMMSLGLEQNGIRDERCMMNNATWESEAKTGEKEVEGNKTKQR